MRCVYVWSLHTSGLLLIGYAYTTGKGKPILAPPKSAKSNGESRGVGGEGSMYAPVGQEEP
jgi:hypothetical protein